MTLYSEADYAAARKARQDACDLDAKGHPPRAGTLARLAWHLIFGGHPGHRLHTTPRELNEWLAERRHAGKITHELGRVAELSRDGPRRAT